MPKLVENQKYINKIYSPPTPPSESGNTDPPKAFSTSHFMISKLKILGAEVVQKGVHWKEADTFLREELLAHDEGGVYVPPFDHEDIWEGHSTMIDEIEKQMKDKGGYSAIVCSVGGGGLFCGLMEGLERHGRLRGGEEGDVKVLAMETIGADSLSLSLRNGKLSRLPAITSIATSLGATQVAEKAFEWGQRPEVKNLVVSDAEAAMASVYFAVDERVLVEAACSASIATAYNGTFSSLLSPGRTASEVAALNVVLVICGGSNISPSVIEEYRQKYSNDEVVMQKFHHG